MIRLLLTIARRPAECRIAVAIIVPLILAEAEAFGLDADRIDGTWPDRHGPASAVVMIHGAGAEVFARRWIRSVQWIALSPDHRRKNWFVGVFDPEPVGPPP